MANKMEPIDLWIINNAERLQLRLTEYTWPSKWWPGLSDLSAKIMIDDIEYIGRGSDLDPTVATRKAIIEATERFVAKSNGCTSSNGVAAHTDRKKAVLGAKQELIERDLFLMHFLTMMPFSTFTPTSLTIPSNLKNNLSAQGVTLYYGVLVDQKDFKGVIAIATGFKCIRPWGLCLGMSVDTSFELASEKATIECLRHIIPLIQDIDLPTPHTINSFKSMSSHLVDDHFKLGLNIDYAKWFVKNFIKDTPSSLRATNTQTTFETFDLVIPNSVSNPPLYVVKSKSTELQDLFFGCTTLEKININRLFSFNPNLRNRLDSVNMYPHPIC
ncbi:MAG: YcaO-like family protein [Bdellovibrio sp.]